MLLERLREDVEKQRRDTKRFDLRCPSCADLDILDTKPSLSDTCQRLAAIPVTSRTVVFDAVTRDWWHSPIKLYPELRYGERQFGNNATWNQHYVGWTEIFICPRQDTDISKLLSKEAIREVAERHAVAIRKSHSRSQKLDRVRTTSEAAYQELFREATTDSAIINPVIEPQIEEIVQRRTQIEHACRALAAI